MSVQQVTVTQIVCRIPSGTLTHSVACSPDAALDEIERAKSGAGSRTRSAHFMSPVIGDLPRHPLIIPSSALDDVIAIYGQTLAVTNDPRAAGQTRTPSGIELPV